MIPNLPAILRSFVVICLLGQWTTAGEYRVIGYYPSWGAQDSGVEVADLPAQRLTHIHYAFAKVHPNGTCVWGNPTADIQRAYPNDTESDEIRGHIGQLLKLRQQHPHLKLVLAIGGWEWSGNFSTMAEDPEKRKRFVDSCLGNLQTLDFDGIDLDWEFPVSGGLNPNNGSPNDRYTFITLLKELRSSLDRLGDRTGKHYELSIAAPGGDENLQYYDLPQIHPQLDYIVVMVYDLWGSWAKVTGLHAPLYASRSAIPSARKRNLSDISKKYAAAGVPKKKFVAGIPFYGRGVVGASPRNRGLYVPHRGQAKGTWNNGMFSYKDLYKNYFTRYPCFWDDAAQAGWMYDPNTGLMVSYEDRHSITAKSKFVKQEGFGGVAVWELSMDMPGRASLLKILSDELLPQTSKQTQTP